MTVVYKRNIDSIVSLVLPWFRINKRTWDLFCKDSPHDLIIKLTSFMNTVEEILAEERKGILFEPRKLSDFLYGKEYAKVLISTLQRNPVPQHDFNVFNRGRV